MVENVGRVVFTPYLNTTLCIGSIKLIELESKVKEEFKYNTLYRFNGGGSGSDVSNGAFKYNTLYRFNGNNDEGQLGNGKFKYNTLYRFNTAIWNLTISILANLNTTLCIGSIQHEMLKENTVCDLNTTLCIGSIVLIFWAVVKA